MRDSITFKPGSPEPSEVRGWKPIPGTKQVLLDFPTAGMEARPQFAKTARTLTTVVHRPFLPMGLIFWGVTEDTYVTRIRVGAMAEGSVSDSGRIPARLFETKLALTELRRLADQGDLHGAVDPRSVMEMEDACTGACVALEVVGPMRDVCMWGLTYTDGYPSSEITIEPYVSEDVSPPNRIPGLEGYQGVVREHTLGGQRDRVKVTAPTIEAVTALLVAHGAPRVRIY